MPAGTRAARVVGCHRTCPSPAQPPIALERAVLDGVQIFSIFAGSSRSFCRFYMSSEQRFTDRDIIERYTDQPSRLPELVRRAIAGASENGAASSVAAYALADLDERLALARTWLVLSTRELVVAKERPTGTHELVRVPRGDVT